eukprot:1671639-Pyramimonas_sp.AAC.1
MHLRGPWPRADSARQLAIARRRGEHDTLRHWSHEVTSFLPQHLAVHWSESETASHRACPQNLPDERLRGHEMYCALVDREGMWSQARPPSLLITSAESDFQQWMEWCVPYVTDLLRYSGFRDLLRCEARSISSSAKRWEVAIEVCMHG